MKLPVGYVAGQGVVKATGFGGYGQRMLEKMGWAKGQGLGKDKDGMKDAIEVKKKEDTLGVGANQSGWDWNWKYWDDAYNSAIKNINHDTDSSSSSSDDSDSSSDDEEPALAGPRDRATTGAAPLPSAAATNRDGTLSTATAAERKINSALAKDAWGRWGGRGGKMARIREQEAAEAASVRASLGLPPPSTAPPGCSSSNSSSDSSDGENDSTNGSGRGGRKRSGKAGAARHRAIGGKAGPSAASDPDSTARDTPAGSEPKKKVGRRPLVVVLKIKDDPARRACEFKPTPSSGWWGAKYFVSAGAMANMEDEAEAEADASGSGQGERRGFDEGDQEALYMRLHGSQRVGRRGMGKSDTLKIAGGKWEGSKVTFDDDGDDNDDSSHGGLEAAMHATAGSDKAPDAKAKKRNNKDSKDKKLKRKRAADVSPSPPSSEQVRSQRKGAGNSRKSDQPPAVEGVAGSTGRDAAAQQGAPQPCRKWIKVARKLLKKAPERRLRARALMEQLHEHGVGPAKGLTSPGSKSDLRKALVGDAKARMAVEGKYVVLVAAGST